ncbi:hypothetical protein Tco_0064632 [Tanacetum coccineum]
MSALSPAINQIYLGRVYLPGPRATIQPPYQICILEPVDPEYRPQETRGGPRGDDDEPKEILSLSADENDGDDEMSHQRMLYELTLRLMTREEDTQLPANAAVCSLPNCWISPSAEELIYLHIVVLIGKMLPELLTISTPHLQPLSHVITNFPLTFSTTTPIPSPSLPVSPPLPISSPVHVLSLSPPASPIRPLGYRATMIRLRA